MTVTPPDAPSKERRLQLLDQAMRHHDYRADALIEVLHAAQDVFGFLDRAILHFIASQLKLPPSKVYGVATFYNHFHTKPKGAHTLTICTGTACHVKGNDQVLAWAKERHQLVPGDTTPDNRLSLLEARCVGACALAPVVLLDNDVRGKMDFEETVVAITTWMDHDAV